jgi:hypothetical protein
MFQNKNIRCTPRNYSLYASMQGHVFDILFALQPTFLDFHSVDLVHSIAAPNNIAAHHRHRLDINDRLLPSIAMTNPLFPGH